LDPVRRKHDTLQHQNPEFNTLVYAYTKLAASRNAMNKWQTEGPPKGFVTASEKAVKNKKYKNLRQQQQLNS
jgi:hypothetical protein